MFVERTLKSGTGGKRLNLPTRGGAAASPRRAPIAPSCQAERLGDMLACQHETAIDSA